MNNITVKNNNNCVLIYGLDIKTTLKLIKVFISLKSLFAASKRGIGIFIDEKNLKYIEKKVQETIDLAQKTSDDIVVEVNFEKNYIDFTKFLFPISLDEYIDMYYDGDDTNLYINKIDYSLDIIKIEDFLQIKNKIDSEDCLIYEDKVYLLVE